MEQEKNIIKVDSIVMPVVTPKEAVEAWKKYQELKKEIAEDEDKQIIKTNQGEKTFFKKSYWRKLATFFNLSVEIIQEKYEFMNENLVYNFTCKATAPNGRSAVGTGSCDSYEKAKFRDGQWQIFDKWKNIWKEAEPNSIHNIRSTAETRAFNRSVSNLVGGGEVSAEEMVEEKHNITSKKEPAPTSSGSAKGGGGEATNICADCKKEISYPKVVQFSTERFGEPVCYNCQKERKNPQQKSDNQDDVENEYQELQEELAQEEVI